MAVVVTPIATRAPAWGRFGITDEASSANADAPETYVRLAGVGFHSQSAADTFVRSLLLFTTSTSGVGVSRQNSPQQRCSRWARWPESWVYAPGPLPDDPSWRVDGGQDQSRFATRALC